MNVSISAVITDLDATASGVQSAIALEALISAAFILINSKVGDLIGRKRAYVIGLCALRRRRAGHDPRPGPRAIVVFWAIIGGVRCVPAPAGHAVADPRQLHGCGPEAGVRAGRRIGRHRRRHRPSHRGVRHDLPVLAGRLRARGGGHRRRPQPDRPGPRRPLRRVPQDRCGGCRALGPRDGRRRARDPRVAGRRGAGRPAHGGRSSGAGLARLVAGATQASGAGDPPRPGPLPAPDLHRRRHRPDAPERHPGRSDDRPPALPADDPRVRRHADGPVDGPLVADHVRHRDGGRQEGRRVGDRPPSSVPASPCPRRASR